MELQELIEQLRSTGAVDSTTLDRLTDASQDPASYQQALMHAFDALDDIEEKTPKSVAAMGILADALSSSRVGEDLASARERRAAVTASTNRAPLGSMTKTRGSVTATMVKPVLTTATAQELPDRDAFIAHATERLNDLARRPKGERLSVLTARWELPEGRRLTADPNQNERIFRAVTGPEALVAAGGVCAPLDVDFTVLALSTDDRPLTTGLPSFGAGRGGLRYIQSPTFADIGASATTIWTDAHDASVPFPNADGTLSGSPTVKPVQAMPCPTEEEVTVDAIPTRVQIGNMAGRFSPEWVEGFMTHVAANAARVAEGYVLNLISSYSTTVSSGRLLGASRDFLATADLVVAAYKDRNRLSDGVSLTVALPRWARNLFRADLTRELANGSDVDTMQLSDAQVDALIRARGLDPIWTLDGQPAKSDGITYDAQGFGAQTTGAVVDWPRELVWHVWATGALVHLDAGRLELGVVRDPTYNSVNVYETFTESFETVLYRGGVEVLEVVSAVRPNGASASSVDTTTY